MAEFTIPLINNGLGLIQQMLETTDSQPLNSAVDLNGMAISTKGAVSLFPGKTEKVAAAVFNSDNIRYQSYYVNSSNVQIPIIYTDDGSNAAWWYGDYSAGTATSLGSVTAGGANAVVCCRQTTDLATGNRILIFTSSHEVPKKSTNLGALATLGGYAGLNYTASYDATSDQSEISQAPSAFSVPTMPFGVEVHKNKTWLISDNLVQHSETFTFETWVNNATNIKRAGWIQINPGDNLGPNVVGFRWQDVLIIGKKRGIYLIYGSHSRGLTPSTVEGDPFKVVRTPSPVGFAGPNAWDYLNDDVIFMDNLGNIRLLSQAILKDQASQDVLSFPVQPEFQKLPAEDRKKVYIRNNTDKKHIWIGYHNGDDADDLNNAVAIYDYRLKNWTFIHDVIKPSSMLFLEDSGFYVGNRTGSIDKQYSGTTHSLGALRPAWYTLPWIKDPKGQRFRIKKLRMDFADVMEGKVLIEVTWQNRKGKYYEILFSETDALSTSEWDVDDWDSAIWGSGTGRDIIPKTIKPRGSGLLAQIKIYSSLDNFSYTWMGGLATCHRYGRPTKT